MKQIRIVLLIIICAKSIFCQGQGDSLPDRRSLNNAGFNLIGNGSLLALNYERLIEVNSHFFFSAMAGVGYGEKFLFCLDDDCPSISYWTLPHHFTLNAGGDMHFLEAGMGGTLINGKTSQVYTYYPTIGYRVQNFYKGGWFFRLYASISLVDIRDEDVFFFPVGFAFGWNF